MPFRFALSCLKYSLPVVVMLAVYCGFYARYFPAPRVTNNVAVNEKFAAFARQDWSATNHPDVLAFGSSMALNNLSSDEVVARLGAKRYFNLGAWGLDMSQTCTLAHAFAERYHPRTIVIAGNLRDFSLSLERSKMRLGPVLELVEKGPGLVSYLTHPEFVYYLRQMESNRLRFTDRANYECLLMDAHGGVALDVPKERILAERWVRPVPETDDLAQKHYDALDRLASGLRAMGIDLIYVTPPYRDGIRTPEAIDAINRHIAKVRGLITARGQYYCDGYDRSWPDDLYADSSHLNGPGARLFTAHALARLKPSMASR